MHNAPRQSPQADSIDIRECALMYSAHESHSEILLYVNQLLIQFLAVLKVEWAALDADTVSTIYGVVSSRTSSGEVSMAHRRPPTARRIRLWRTGVRLLIALIIVGCFTAPQRQVVAQSRAQDMPADIRWARYIGNQPSVFRYHDIVVVCSLGRDIIAYRQDTGAEMWRAQIKATGSSIDGWQFGRWLYLSSGGWLYRIDLARGVLEDLQFVIYGWGVHLDGNGTLFLADAGVDETDVVTAIDMETFEVRWTVTIPTASTHNPTTIVLIPGAVVTQLADGRVLALDVADGHVRWTAPITAAGTLAAHSALVLVTDGDRQTLYGLARDDGRLLWQTPVHHHLCQADADECFSNLLEVYSDDRQIYTIISMEGPNFTLRYAVSAFDPQTGALLWERKVTAEALPLALGEARSISRVTGSLPSTRAPAEREAGEFIYREDLGYLYAYGPTTVQRAVANARAIGAAGDPRSALGTLLLLHESDPHGFRDAGAEQQMDMLLKEWLDDVEARAGSERTVRLAWVDDIGRKNIWTLTSTLTRRTLMALHMEHHIDRAAYLIRLQYWRRVAASPELPGVRRYLDWFGPYGLDADTPGNSWTPELRRTALHSLIGAWAPVLAVPLVVTVLFYARRRLRRSGECRKSDARLLIPRSTLLTWSLLTPYVLIGVDPSFVQWQLPICVMGCQVDLLVLLLQWWLFLKLAALGVAVWQATSPHDSGQASASPLWTDVTRSCLVSVGIIALRFITAVQG